MANIQHYIFIDESGDPGKPFETDATGNKTKISLKLEAWKIQTKSE